MPDYNQGFDPYGRPINSDNTLGVPVSYSGMTIYELLRSIVRSLNWTQENTNNATDFIDHLETVGFFGNLGDTMESKEMPAPLQKRG